MPKYQAKNTEIERWIHFRREEGFEVAEVKRSSICEVNGRKTSIHFGSPRKDGTFWFSIGLTQLEDMDYFVWLCEKAENYYVIPRKKMKELATSWLSSTQHRFHFRLDIKTHEYVAHVFHDISLYYQNSKAFFW